MNTNLFVGIDVSKSSNSVRIINGEGKTLKLFTVKNDLNGATELCDKIRQIVSDKPFDNIVIGMEATSYYADHLAAHLKGDEFLKTYNTKVFVLNPKQVANFKKSYNDIDKTDALDTLVIADFLRLDRLPKEFYRDEKQIALRSLTRARFQLAQDLSRAKVRYLDTLFQKFSTLDSSNVFSNTFGATATAVATEFMTVDEIVNMDLDDLAAFINEKGKGNFADPDAIATALKAAALSSYRLPRAVADSLNQLLAVRLVSIRALSDQIKTLDKSIEQFMGAFQNVLISIPGIGKVYSAGIIAEIGDIHRFDKGQAALAKYAGFVWKRHQSGNFEAANTKLISSGNRYLRYFLIEAANQVRMHDTEFARFYSSKFKEVPKHQQKRALALTARKLVRVVYSLLVDNKLYIPPLG
jgi:transposase